jgi:DNA-binding response OmpR family regulator
VTTVLICAGSDLEPDLRRTLFWREDLERYVAERTDEARVLAFSTEPHVVVVELELPGIDKLLDSLRTQSLPHPVSIVALTRAPATAVVHPRSDGVDAVLALPPGPEWDDRLVDVLQMPTRKQLRFEVAFGVEARLRHRSITQRSLALNISAGGILIGGRDLQLHAGDDVNLTLQIPVPGDPVEGRARVIRQPIEERLGLRFEAFSGDGDERIREFLAALASAPSS